MGGSRALSLGWPLVAGQLAATTPTLGALSLSPAVATLGVAYTGTISGATPGSNIVLDSLTVSGTGTTRTVTGTPSSAGSWAAVETLSGANGSPRTTSDILLVSAASAGIQSIRADGWSGDYASTPPTFTPNTSPTTLSVTRQGFTNTGAPTTFTENVVITQRVRQPVSASTVQGTYPLDPTRVALSTNLYSTDTVMGVTNNSTETSPVPIFKWPRPPHSTVGNTLRAECVTMHRNARNREAVACVIFTATDGTNTVTQTVATSSILGHSGDLNPVVGYAADLDITSLNNGAVTLNAKVYPWVGGASSVVDTSTGTLNARDFAPQVHQKSLTAKSYAYVAPTGVDASGVVSATAATAAATPYLTLQGAFNGIRTAGVKADDAVVRISGDISFTASTSANLTQTEGAIFVERDPNVTRAAAIVRIGVNAALGVKHIWYRDLTIIRSNFYLGANATFAGSSGAGTAVIENINLDNGSVNATLWSSSVNIAGYAMGVTLTNGVNGMTGPGTVENRLWRGISASGLSFEGLCFIGSSVAAGQVSFANGRLSNVFVGFNKAMSCTATWSAFGATAAVGDATGMAFVQNLVEYIATTDQPVYRPSSDTAYSNLVHFCDVNNTVIGYKGLGRTNALYDDTTDKFRAHRLAMFNGSIHAQFNFKSDIFVRFFTAFPTPEQHVNSWNVLYGVDCNGVVSCFGNKIDHVPNGSFGMAAGPEFAGLNALSGGNPDETAPNNVPIDPLYTSYKGTASDTVAGTGGGTYTLQAGSPVIGRVKQPALRFDLAGVLRGATTASGAYAASAGN